MAVHYLDRAQARRIAVRAQLLDHPRPPALRSPFDRLVHDRVRPAEVFESEYTLEMYKPKGQRRWGYFALPILYGDRLVGKLDAAADRKAGVLRVDAIHEDIPFTKAISNAVHSEIDALASWLGLTVTGPAARGRRR
jgi:uncharacterized protein